LISQSTHVSSPPCVFEPRRKSIPDSWERALVEVRRRPSENPVALERLPEALESGYGGTDITFKPKRPPFAHLVGHGPRRGIPVDVLREAGHPRT
jgi:hypothetical protein